MNAKQEFIEHTANRGLGIKCARINKGEAWDNKETEYLLPCNYTAADMEAFLKSIDWNYDSGYGGQELFGIIWYNDGTWSDRGEYDGSEWWEHNSCPVISDTLLNKTQPQ